MKFILNTIFLLFSLSLLAQSASEAEVVFNNKQYAKAKIVYEQLLKRKPNDAFNNYRYARCNYELKNYETAIKHFGLTSSRYALKDYYLADLYFKTYRFRSAIEAAQHFQATLEPNDMKMEEMNQLIKKSELGAKLINRVEQITIIDSNIVNKSDFLKYYHLSVEIGTLEHSRLKTNTKLVQDQITFTTQRGDRKFVSDTLKGNMDIRTSYKLVDEWSPSVSISPRINTKANESYPFLLLDGISLYFASDGENSLGGYDIFMTKYSSSSKDFLTPENVGFPFNSTANDYMMVIDEAHKTGWFATDRNQVAGKVAIYNYEYNYPKLYFKSEDSLEVAQVAQLKSYKIRKQKIQSSKKTVVENNEITPNDTIIVINDSIVYNHPMEFRQAEALQLYNESILKTNELQKLEETLEVARIKYEHAASTNEKQKIADQIQLLEPAIFELSKEIILKNKAAINKENNFLSNK